MFLTMRATRSHDLTTERIGGHILRALRTAAREHGVRISAYCLMPDHLHAVASAKPDGGDLAAWVRAVKRHSARCLRLPGMWQRSYWDRHAREIEDVGKMIAYVVRNPVRESLCESWEQWPWSWSAWHEGGLGPDPNPAKTRPEGA
jgi:putative transposase